MGYALCSLSLYRQTEWGLFTAGGCIYTQVTDVGAGLVAQVVAGLDEDAPINPVTIADNVGDIPRWVWIYSELFAESICAALVIAAFFVRGVDNTLSDAGWDAMFPVVISAAGIIICMLCFFVATSLKPVTSQDDIVMVVKVQMALTALAMLRVIFFPLRLLPAELTLECVRLKCGQSAKVIGLVNPK